MSAKKIEWFVYYHNMNAQEIQAFNIFNHGSFRVDVEKYLKKYKDKEEFAERLKRSLMYYFWSKSEYEVIISPWCGARDTKDIKIDIYNQVMNNWDIFLDYVWDSKVRRPRKEYADWEYDPDGTDWGIGAWRCTKCHAKNNNLGCDNNFSPYMFAGSKFCPNCGLPMKSKNK